MRYPVPDEAQKSLLHSNGIDPEGVFVVHSCEEYLVVQNYKTGDEICVRPNDMKRRGVRK